MTQNIYDVDTDPDAIFDLLEKAYGHDDAITRFEAMTAGLFSPPLDDDIDAEWDVIDDMIESGLHVVTHRLAVVEGVCGKGCGYCPSGQCEVAPRMALARSRMVIDVDYEDLTEARRLMR